MKLVYGKGLNDSKTPVIDRCPSTKQVIWRCPFYSRWANMLKRCYSKSSLSKRPSYIGTSVCDEWLLFSNFRKWMSEQDWNGNHLDKDLLGDSNIYSPSTCVFVSPEVNSFVKGKKSSKGLPMGVQKARTSGKFLASMLVEGSRVHFGTFESVESAERAYLSEKIRFAKVLAEKQTDSRVSEAIIRRFSAN